MTYSAQAALPAEQQNPELNPSGGPLGWVIVILAGTDEEQCVYAKEYLEPQQAQLWATVWNAAEEGVSPNEIASRVGCPVARVAYIIGKMPPVSDGDMLHSGRKVPKTVPILIGRHYPFFSEVQQEYEPPEKRLRRFTGTMVEVLRECPQDEGRFTYMVKAHDGTEFDAHPEEINGWDYALNQFFWPDAKYGKDHDDKFLCNERK